MNKGIVLGIDFSADYTQMSVLGDGNEPESLKMSGLGDEYLMPTVMFYNTDLQEWAVGIEAVNRSRVEDGIFIDKLPDRMNQSQGINVDEQEIKWSNVAAKFFESVITVAINRVNGAMIKNIVISVDDPEENIMQALYGAIEILGYEKSMVRVINHAESYAYYVLNQNRDVWINNVLMVDFNETKPVLRKLFVTKGREPYVVDVKKEDISDKINYKMLATEDGCIKADKILSSFLSEEVEENVVSAVYLNGQGFMKEGWYKQTIEAIYNNRRIFAGNNLIVRGAIYAAKEFFFTSTLDSYVISCKGRTKVNVSMDVVHRGTETKVKLSKAGVHWYEAGAKTQCIINNVDKAHFTIVSPATKEVREFEMGLEAFPKRNNKTVRVEISLAYTAENTFVVEIKDIGFGEFFEASAVTVRHEVQL